MKKGKDYILIPEIPNEDQEPFQKWLWGKTRPIIEEEGINSMNCCYKSDYERWKSFHKIQEYGSKNIMGDDAKKSTHAKEDNSPRNDWEAAAKQASKNGDDEMLMDKSDKKWNLNELLKNINDDNIHPEINTGDSIGEEN